MFDLSNGVVRTKLLTEKAQGDGYPVHKDRPDFVKKAINILGSQVTNKLWRSGGRKLGEKPMKLLIAQELSNTVELKEKSPNIVAKLMGLNSLPVQQKVQTPKKVLQNNHSPQFSSRTYHHRQQRGEDYYNQMKDNSDLHINKRSYKDVYEVKQKLSSDVQLENENKPHNEDYRQNLAEKRLSLVRQKFTEAKRLATNEKLLQSKEFKEALEVLSSNRDLFLKLLEEPNSLFNNQLKELNQTISIENQTKCITVLKPVTSGDIDHEKSVRKNRYTCGKAIKDFDGHDLRSSLFAPMAEAVSQPTRIVVLKASTEMPPERRYINGDLIVDEDISSREIVDEITYEVQKDLRSKQMNMYPKATDLSIGHLADHGSLNRSEDDYGEEGGSDSKDSELMTPTSRNSWVHTRSESPGSLSTFSHASYSFESSVSKEAKKQLSEQWESVISNDINHERTNVRKSSSTLSEMLAIPDVKKGEGADKLVISPSVSYHQEQYRGITSSKSLPSSPYHENIREKEDISHTLSSKSILLKQVTKVKNVKSSFTEKVSALFVDRMKTLVRDKPSLLCSARSDGRLFENSSSAVKDSNQVKDSHGRISHKKPPKTLEEKIVKFLSPISVSGTAKHRKGIRSIEKLWKSEVYRENCYQSGYISVLEMPMQEDFPSNISHSSQSAIICDPQALSRSPLISSVSRSSSNRESLHSDTVSINSLKLFKLFSKEDEEQERFAFITNLLSSSSFANETSTALLAKSHSLDSPLDPTLLDKFLDRKGEEAKCRERRSNQMLYFDSVNVALKDICRCSLMNAYPWSTTTVRTQKHVKANLSVKDAVWRYLKHCTDEVNCASGKAENSEKYVDYLVKKEVAGSGLAESMWLEVDKLSKEIGEALFDDALTDLIML